MLTIKSHLNGGTPTSLFIWLGEYKMTETTSAIEDGDTAGLAVQDKKKRIFAIVGASSGNLVEWFDFYVYSFCS